MAPFWLVCGLLTASIPAPAPASSPPTPAVAPAQIVVGLTGTAAPFTADALARVLAGYLADL